MRAPCTGEGLGLEVIIAGDGRDPKDPQVLAQGQMVGRAKQAPLSSLDLGKLYRTMYLETF